MRGGGYQAESMREAEYDIKDIKNAGYPVIELRAGKYTAQELKDTYEGKGSAYNLINFFILFFSL